MNYFSTRDKSLKFSFKDIFLRGLAPDGGLFLPAEIKKYNQEAVSYTHLRAHETDSYLVCRLLLEKKK